MLQINKIILASFDFRIICRRISNEALILYQNRSTTPPYLLVKKPIISRIRDIFSSLWCCEINCFFRVLCDIYFNNLSNRLMLTKTLY